MKILYLCAALLGAALFSVSASAQERHGGHEHGHGGWDRGWHERGHDWDRGGEWGRPGEWDRGDVCVFQWTPLGYVRVCPLVH